LSPVAKEFEQMNKKNPIVNHLDLIHIPEAVEKKPIACIVNVYNFSLLLLTFSTLTNPHQIPIKLNEYIHKNFHDVNGFV